MSSSSRVPVVHSRLGVRNRVLTAEVPTGYRHDEQKKFNSVKVLLLSKAQKNEMFYLHTLTVAGRVPASVLNLFLRPRPCMHKTVYFW